MHLRDATSVFGRVVILIPLILIFLTAADSAFACPGKTGVAYRTRAISNRTVSYMPTTVISYRAPASYRRCGANMYDTRGAKYVAVRQNGSSARFVAVRNDAPRPRYVAVRTVAPRTRYIAVQNVDLDDDLRYVAVRRDPYRAEAGTRVIAVRSGYRNGNGIVAYIDNEPRYVAVQRIVPRTTRYVAVRDVDIDDEAPRYVAVRSVAPRTKYVAVRNIDSGCTRAIALRSCLDDVETASTKHVVLRTDDADTKYVAVRDDIDDDAVVVNDESDYDVSMIQNESDDYDLSPLRNYTAVPSTPTRYVEYRDASYSNYETPVALRTRPITYVVSDDSDVDDQAYFDEDGATYVAADDIDDACLPRHVVGTRSVSYVPASYVDDDATYVVTENAAPAVRYVAVDDVDDVDVDAVSYAPVENVEVVDAETVSYVPAEHVEVVDAETVSYVPAENVESTTVSYLPTASVDSVDTTYVAADACPMPVSSIDAKPVYVANASTVLVEDVDNDLVAGLSSTQRIAGGFGYRDGFEDGREAALEGDLYHPENSGDYQKATEGYEDDFGNKDVYKATYRNTYLDGYRAGFESVNGSA